MGKVVCRGFVCFPKVLPIFMIAFLKVDYGKEMLILCRSQRVNSAHS